MSLKPKPRKSKKKSPLPPPTDWPKRKSQYRTHKIFTLDSIVANKAEGDKRAEVLREQGYEVTFGIDLHVAQRAVYKRKIIGKRILRVVKRFEQATSFA